MNFDLIQTVRSVKIDFSGYEPTDQKEIVISIGKSASFMYSAFCSQFPDNANLPFLIITPEKTPVESGLLAKTIFSTHPGITQKSFEAFEKLNEFIHSNCPERITVLLSGGSSALIEKSENPEKTIHTNEILLKSGKSIVEINRIRGENSLIKNGKLALLFPDILWNVFVMSDIPFENGEIFVGSMPFFRNDLKNTTLFKCADSDTLHDHILKQMNSGVHSIRKFNGTVDDLAEIIIHFIQNSSEDLLVTGEPLLKVGRPISGTGGRMSHLALKILPYLDRSMSFYSLGSDGIDGNSTLAGAMIRNFELPSELISEVNVFLEKFDSAEFLQKQGLGLNCGYSGVNLNDIVIFTQN